MDNQQPALETNWELTINSFDGLNLKLELIQGIYTYGFATPSLMQSKAIRPILDHKDIIAQCQSGSGKTGAYLIPILQTIDTAVHETQALILVPTGELALQIQKVLVSVGMFLQISAHLCVTGQNLQEGEKEKLPNGAHVIIGTPDSVAEIIKAGNLKLETIKTLVLDEADELLGREKHVKAIEIMKKIPKGAQTALFSTTLPLEILSLTRPFLRDPAIILVNNHNLVPEDVKQFYVAHENEDQKVETVAELCKTIGAPQQCVIFCNSAKTVDELALKLHAKDILVSSIHENMELNHRETTLNEFQAGTHKVLVTTDLLARGIDMPQVSIVINYDMPISKEGYINRIGRCARFGRKNAAFSLKTPKDDEFIKNVETSYNTEILELSRPLNAANIFE